MGSKFGFGDLAKSLKVAERNFLRKGTDLAKEEFDSNFEARADKGDDKGGASPWNPLIYRREPPPILQLTGQMRSLTATSQTQFGEKFAFFIINPVDSRGRHYAAYHHEGTPNMAKRRTVVQSKQLDSKQLNALKSAVDAAFEGRGKFK